MENEKPYTRRKTIAITKSSLRAFIATAPKYVVNKLEKIQKTFLWNNSTPKIKHETLCNDYKAGGLKMSTFETKLNLFNVSG